MAVDRVLPLAVSVLAMVVMLAVGFVFLASGLVAPEWAVMALCALWLVAWVPLWRLPPRWRPVVPVALAVTWVVVVSLGDQLGGWTA